MIQHMEHYEIAGYGCARAFAEVLDEAGVAELLQETLEEEEDCDRRLTRLAENVVNVDAEAHSL
jgi:ferritin-like metal-binding protein YciE